MSETDPDPALRVPRTPAPQGRRDTPALRKVSTLLSIWGLCERRTCLRAQACHGDPRTCLAHYAPLVPQAVRECVKNMIEAKSHGLDFEEFREEADLSAYAEWEAAIRDFAHRRRERRRQVLGA